MLSDWSLACVDRKKSRGAFRVTLEGENTVVRAGAVKGRWRGVLQYPVPQQAQRSEIDELMLKVVRIHMNRSRIW